MSVATIFNGKSTLSVNPKQASKLGSVEVPRTSIVKWAQSNYTKWRNILTEESVSYIAVTNLRESLGAKILV